MVDSQNDQNLLNADIIDALRESLDDDTVKQLMESLLDEITNTVEFVTAARADNRWQDIEVRVHGLKSAALGLGAEPLGNVAADCEKTSHAVLQGDDAISDFDADYARLTSIADGTLAAVRGFLT